jgi:GNAT superfamily N-acetyltransferase
MEPGVTRSVNLRVLTEADVVFADQVRALAGWNQTLADWQRFLATEPEGCFLAEWEGRPAGTATTTVYGPELAWIGMVLVHPDYQRRGIGGSLLGHCVAYLRQRGVRCIKLDATPLGRPVYERLGFAPEWSLSRWARSAAVVGPVGSAAGLGVWGEDEPVGLAGLDAEVFGAPRGRLLQALRAQSLAALVSEPKAGRLEGYGLVRPGARAAYLGPVVARAAERGRCLAEALIERAGEQAIYWDIPDQNTAAVDCARAQGFSPQRSLLRMFLGENSSPGKPGQQFALASPETG